jgi:hypothetical protein
MKHRRSCQSPAISAWGGSWTSHHLAELGKVAGVAIGLIALLAPKFIKGASSLPRAEQAPMFRLVVIGAFAIGALGIIAWVIAGAQMGTSVTTGNCGIATSGTATSNSVNCGSPPPAQPKQP